MPNQSAIANTINSFLNQQDKGSLSSRVMDAIKTASTRTGVDFSYLLQKASQESGFDPSAKATTSSATGLFQFTSQTWLQMVKSSGAQYGLGAYAAQITSDSTGHLSVSNPATRQAILALRNDPQISAEMAGELDKQNAISLRQKVGGKVGATELYLAHFLGAGGASSFIEKMRSDPSASGAAVLPDAAAANPSVFYSKSGEPRSLSEIYQHFAQKFSPTQTQIASGYGTNPGSLQASQTSVNAARLSSNQSAALPAASSLPSFRMATASTINSSTPSTLFTAMLMGQLNGTAAAPTSGLSAFNQENDKKKDAMAVLASVA